MPDLFWVLFDGIDLEQQERLELSAVSDVSVPDEGSNFLVTDFIVDSGLLLPEGGSNFVVVRVDALCDCSSRLNDLLRLKFIGVPFVSLLTSSGGIYIADYTLRSAIYFQAANATLVLISSIAEFFEYSEFHTFLSFGCLPLYNIVSCAEYSGFLDLLADAGIDLAYGSCLSDFASVSASADVAARLRLEVAPLLFSAKARYEGRLFFFNLVNLLASCRELFKISVFDELAFSSSVVDTYGISTATLIRERASASSVFVGTAELLNKVLTSADALFRATSIARYTSILDVGSEAGLVLVVPKVSSLVTAWYTVPGAISMHDFSPSSVCSCDETLYLAFDDGIYVFGDEVEDETALVYNFGDLGLPVFKRFGDMFISGEFERLKVAVDLDDVRVVYGSDINKIEFAKGHRGYNARLFIKGLKSLNSMELSIVLLSKRRRFG